VHRRTRFTSRALCQLAYVFLNCIGLLLPLYRAGTMGLLPSGRTAVEDVVRQVCCAVPSVSSARVAHAQHRWWSAPSQLLYSRWLNRCKEIVARTLFTLII
jgi:hypothetical protein